MSLWRLTEPFELAPRPSRLLDQHFGLGLDLEDLLINRQIQNLTATGGYYNYRPWQAMASRQDTGSTLVVDKDKFQVNLDVQQFKPEEISVKVTGDDSVKVEGKHDERQDEHGFISRHFVRKYIVPKGHDIGKIESTLSSDGVLTITAPKITTEMDYRKIPVMQTGQPSKAEVPEKKEEQELVVEGEKGDK